MRGPGFDDDLRAGNVVNGSQFPSGPRRESGYTAKAPAPERAERNPGCKKIKCEQSVAQRPFIREYVCQCGDSLREPGPWRFTFALFGECLPHPDNHMELNKDKLDAWVAHRSTKRLILGIY